MIDVAVYFGSRVPLYVRIYIPRSDIPSDAYSTMYAPRERRISANFLFLMATINSMRFPNSSSPP